MRIMTYNILEGGTGRIDPIAEVVRLAAADVVIVEETWDPALFHKLADRLHMDRFIAENPRNPQGSTGLLSRFPIREAANLAALDPRLTKSAFTAVLETRNPKLETPEFLGILGLHLHHYETHADEAIRLQELAALLEYARTLPPAHLLGGDFNASHPQQIIDLTKARPTTRQRVAPQQNQFPRQAIASVLAAGYADAHALHRTPADFGTSFTTAHPAMRVDYLFTSPALTPRVTSCDIFKPEIGRFASDHYPVVATIE